MTTYKSNIPKKSKIPQRIRQSWNRPIRPPEPEKSWWETLSVEMKGVVVTAAILVFCGLMVLLATYVPTIFAYTVGAIGIAIALVFLWGMVTAMISLDDKY